MIYFLILIFVILLGGLLITNFLKDIFGKEPYYIIIQLFVVGIILNICILLYNKIIFRKINIKIGKRGKQGDGGIKGLMGNNDSCSKCENDFQNDTVGNEKIKSDNKKTLNETPVLSTNIRGKPL